MDDFQGQFDWSVRGMVDWRNEEYEIWIFCILNRALNVGGVLEYKYYDVYLKCVEISDWCEEKKEVENDDDC